MEEKASNHPVIVVAGANGHLGQKIVTHLVSLGARPKAMVREEGPATLRIAGAETVAVDYNNLSAVAAACRRAHCVVSALSGLEDVIVGLQTTLLNAAVEAGVPRFIPSDYCIDYTKLPDGSNRNLDLRRQFAQRLEAAPTRATSVLNGMFTDLLLGEAPLVQARWKRVLYWGNADQPLDFTTINDTALVTATAATESDAPRYLRIAGDTVSSRGLQQAASRAAGQPFKLTRIGSLGLLKAMTGVTKVLLPKPEEVFPPWQGMQYLHNMYTGMPRLQLLDNGRYPDMRWTTVL